MIYTLSKVRDPSKTLTVILHDPIPQDSTWTIGKAVLEDVLKVAVVSRVKDDQLIAFCVDYAGLPRLLQQLKEIDPSRINSYHLCTITSVSPHKGIRPRRIACRYVIEYSL